MNEKYMDCDRKNINNGDIISSKKIQSSQNKRNIKLNQNTNTGTCQDLVDGGPTLWKAFLAELLGTMVIIGDFTRKTMARRRVISRITIASGFILTVWDQKSPPTVLQIAFAFGTTRVAVTQAIGSISGAHINPAVSLSFILAGRIRPVKGLLYILLQCVGAVMGALILTIITPKEVQGNLGCTIPNVLVDPVHAMIIEAVITCLYCLIHYKNAAQIANDGSGSGRLEVGFFIVASHLFANRYTGSSMNPARSLGPAVVANVWENFWVYWVGPCLGGMLAAFIYCSSFYKRKPTMNSRFEDKCLEDIQNSEPMTTAEFTVSQISLRYQALNDVDVETGPTGRTVKLT